MRVLITGANGQVGQLLCRRFERAAHHEVIATDRRTLDIDNRDSVLSAITVAEPDVVIHPAAMCNVDACERNPDAAMRSNALGTRHVAQAADVAGARVVYVSTDYVFDGEKGAPYTEWDETSPLSVYGSSKLGGERELRWNDLVVRTSWVYSANGTNLLTRLVEQARSSGEVPALVDQRGIPTCAPDLVDRIYELTVAGARGVHHVTNEGDGASRYEIAVEVFAFLGLTPERIRPLKTAELDPPLAARRPADSRLDNTAMRLAGMPAMPDFREALKRTIAEVMSK